LNKSKISGSQRIEVENEEIKVFKKLKYMKSKIEAFEDRRFKVWRLNPSLRLK
jgi:hypothetical protein